MPDIYQPTPEQYLTTAAIRARKMPVVPTGQAVAALLDQIAQNSVPAPVLSAAGVLARWILTRPTSMDVVFPSSIVLTDDAVVIDGVTFPWWIAELGVEVTLRDPRSYASSLAIEVLFLSDETTITDHRTSRNTE